MWLIERLEGWGDREAIVWRGRSYSYRWLRQAIEEWVYRVRELGLTPGQVVAVDGEYSPQLCALLLALIDHRHIVVPLTSATRAQTAERLQIAQVQLMFRFEPDETWHVERRSVTVDHPLLIHVQQAGASGLVLFSSGSTGTSKAIVHRMDRLLEKFIRRRRCLRTLVFLLLDHIGGINTLFYTLANGGTVIVTEDRSPEAVCRLIEQHRVELLPTSPTFLNLLLISEAYAAFDLSSLTLVTYGTEPMPATTLERLTAVFPHCRFLQTYGLSEVGILHSQSKASSSLWVKVGGEGFETKVVNNVLWIRSRSAMLGYLNAPSPFDAEGWFNTQDVVEVDGDYLRILGRETDLINVGGEKVYPAEVESVLLQMEHVRDAAVRGERHPIMGQIVVASVSLVQPEAVELFKRRMRAHCKERLAPYKIPLKVELVEGSQISERLKKRRVPQGASEDRQTMEAHAKR